MAMATEMETKMTTETTTPPVLVAYKPDSVVIPQITLELHKDGHMERQEMICTLVVYASTLKLITK